MISGEVFAGDAPQIVTGDFGFCFQPDDDGSGDGPSSHVSFSFGRSDAQAGGTDAMVEFARIKPLTRSFAGALDDIDRFADS